MNSVEEKYHIVADSKLSGSYYVSYYSVGGGYYEFGLTKSPLKFYSSLQECIPMKELFERAVNENGVHENDNFIYVNNESLEGIDSIVNVKIQKSIVTKQTEISYID